MLEWVIDNKEWVFSGIGVLIIGTIIGFVVKKKAGTFQKQKSGNNSVNIQSTGTINIGNSLKGDKDVRN